ncbi:MAG: uppS [Chlamydiia bacterium]|nr:uppS [Chlamydiia bacterium]
MTCNAETRFFSEETLQDLSKATIPHHIAIIPDGNRRWAKGHFLEVTEGYLQGAETLITIIQAAKEIGVKVLTVFSFSTENWLRPKPEIDAVMKIMEEYLKNYQEKLMAMSIRFNVIGNTDLLPQSLINVINETKTLTQEGTKFDLILAMNYGGRDEIIRATKKIATDYKENKILLHDLTENTFSAHLDTSKWPDPDLIIRTSGEKRISNFLLWQSSYAEIYIEKATWPDFTPHHLLSAVLDYQSRDRRRGGGII